MALDANRQFRVSVSAATPVPIEIEYPATAAVTETFDLFFDYDEPVQAGWTVTPPALLTDATFIIRRLHLLMTALKTVPHPQDRLQ